MRVWESRVAEIPASCNKLRSPICRQITYEVTLISSDHNHSNNLVIVDLAMGQIPPSQNVFLVGHNFIFSRLLSIFNSFNPKRQRCSHESWLKRFYGSLCIFVQIRTVIKQGVFSSFLESFDPLLASVLLMSDHTDVTYTVLCVDTTTIIVSRCWCSMTMWHTLRYV